MKASKQVVTADMLHDLPESVQRYLTYAGVVGRSWINTVRLKYGGRFRLGADKPWMAIEATQFYTTNPPGFLWKARFKLAGLPLFIGRDTYKNGHGHIYGKLAGLFTLFDVRGDEMDQGTMVRYLQEMVWFPTALLGDNISWQAGGDHSAEVTLHDAGRSVSARVFFDDSGRLINFVTQRYAESNGSYTLKTWATPMTAYSQHAGLNLPVRGTGVWQQESGDLPYIDLEIDEIAHNEPIESF